MDTSEKQALTEIYAQLLGTGGSTATDFEDATITELKTAILEHFQPRHMEELFKEAFSRGINYALYQQKQSDKALAAEDFFGEHGFITEQIDWDEVMLDW
ncbi:hypothetical protein KEF85_16460 [Methylomonas paludis]|uniref:Uncharacterized protein n=1 Tax=Methylomonas paludis TaxID=1173101 RepID=A0A975R9A5_9GAMM|nr:hypothetical protein [Methylomonas paludis]QWF70877.1 hypothetical protein KEF85_16460 [Methylomonas paludis]